MGRATITANIGEGLYQAILEYDWSKIDEELAELIAAKADHDALLAEALRSWELREQERREAKAGLDDVLAQWIEDLLGKDERIPPKEPDDPVDPETGQPWEDKDRAWDTPLFEALNAARVAAGLDELERSGELDEAALNIARWGWRPEEAATAAGYSWDLLAHQMAIGATSPEAAVARWQRGAAMSDDYTDVGAAYYSDEESPYTHFWTVVLATPGVKTSAVRPPDPAEEKAEETEEELERIKPPETEAEEPPQVQECVLAYRVALASAQAALAVVDRLRLEQASRNARISMLEGIISAAQTPIHIWAAEYVTDLEVGAEIATAEVPGWYQADPVYRTTMVLGTPYSYLERQVNLTPQGGGVLRHCEGLSDAVVFVNLAMEPGHLKWRPQWRYGTITAVGVLYSVDLEQAFARTAFGIGEDLDLQQSDSLTDVPAVCACSTRLAVGDEVLIAFSGDWIYPEIIGWRREPKGCGGGRVSWGELF